MPHLPSPCVIFVYEQDDGPGLRLLQQLLDDAIEVFRPGAPKDLFGGRDAYSGVRRVGYEGSDALKVENKTGTKSASIRAGSIAAGNFLSWEVCFEFAGIFINNCRVNIWGGGSESCPTEKYVGRTRSGNYNYKRVLPTQMKFRAGRFNLHRGAEDFCLTNVAVITSCSVVCKKYLDSTSSQVGVQKPVNPWLPPKRELTFQAFNALGF